MMKEEPWRNGSKTPLPLFFDEGSFFLFKKRLWVCNCSKINIKLFVISDFVKKIQFISFLLPYAFFLKCHFFSMGLKLFDENRILFQPNKFFSRNKISENKNYVVFNFGVYHSPSGNLGTLLEFSSLWSGLHLYPDS